MSQVAQSDDCLTSLERKRAFRAVEPYDRIPGSAMLSKHASLALGVTTAEYSHSASLIARGQIAAWRRRLEPEGAQQAVPVMSIFVGGIGGEGQSARSTDRNDSPFLLRTPSSSMHRYNQMWENLDMHYLTIGLTPLR